MNLGSVYQAQFFEVDTYEGKRISSGERYAAFTHWKTGAKMSSLTLVSKLALFDPTGPKCNGLRATYSFVLICVNDAGFLLQ